MKNIKQLVKLSAICCSVWVICLGVQVQTPASAAGTYTCTVEAGPYKETDDEVKKADKKCDGGITTKKSHWIICKCVSDDKPPKNSNAAYKVRTYTGKNAEARQKARNGRACTAETLVLNSTDVAACANYVEEEDFYDDEDDAVVNDAVMDGATFQSVIQY